MNPIETFSDYLKTKDLKLTSQRKEILEAFLNTERHVTTEELYNIVKKKTSNIGHATVFRTLKLMSEAGLARTVNLGSKVARFEHKLGHEHHDHLVCIKCGRCIEAVDPEIEKLQKRLTSKFSFTPTSHKMEIFGICKNCRRKSKLS